MRAALESLEQIADAAVCGYVAGGARLEAAKEVVAGAVADLRPLIAGDIDRETIATFTALLDFHSGKFIRTRGARAFIEER
jgi:hypothetical protein